MFKSSVNAPWYQSPRLLVLLLLTFTTWAVATAKEVVLVKTSSDKDDVVETFSVELDEQGRLNRLWQRVVGRPDRSYTLAQLEKGVVLRQEAGHDAVRFRSLKLDPKQGGHFRMEYLYSGVPPEEYRTMDLELRYEEGDWHLFSGKDARPVTGLHFLTNVTSFLGMKKIVGIRAVQVKR